MDIHWDCLAMDPKHSVIKGLPFIYDIYVFLWLTTSVTVFSCNFLMGLLLTVLRLCVVTLYSCSSNSVPIISEIEAKHDLRLKDKEHYLDTIYMSRATRKRSLISTFVVHCLDRIISLVFISEISILWLASVAVQARLCPIWSQTPKAGFLETRLICILASFKL